MAAAENGLPDHPSPFLDSNARTTLQTIWDVTEVDLIDAPIADKTGGKRHCFVFTKLRAFEVPYRHIIFFDLDIVVRFPPQELFLIEAPAAMYQGKRDGRNARHGEPILPEAFHNFRGCVNAGLMRLDPPISQNKRRYMLESLVKKVKQLKKEDASYLPEQYFLVKEIHISQKNNTEMVVLQTDLPPDWFALGSSERLAKNVRLFHFSGLWIMPWWYIHVTPQTAFNEISKAYSHRDSRGMVALAVKEWLIALQDLLTFLAGTEQGMFVEAVVDRLKWIAQTWWDDQRECELDSCCGYLDETGLCEECMVRSKLPEKNVSPKAAPVSKTKRPRHFQQKSVKIIYQNRFS